MLWYLTESKIQYHLRLIYVPLYWAQLCSSGQWLPKPQLLVLLSVPGTLPGSSLVIKTWSPRSSGAGRPESDWPSYARTSSFRVASIMFTVVWASTAPALKSSITRSLQAQSSPKERSNITPEVGGIQSHFDQWVTRKERKLLTIPHHTSRCSDTQWPQDGFSRHIFSDLKQAGVLGRLWTAW